MKAPATKSVIFVFSFFLLLLLGWFVYSAIGIKKGLQTKSWSLTKGTVISSEVKRLHSSKGSSKSTPLIKYSYQVDTTGYISEKYSSTTARGSSMWAQEIVNQHPENSEIDVYYDPSNPQKSVLVTGLQSDDYWMSIISLFFIIVVTMAFVKQLKGA